MTAISFPYGSTWLYAPSRSTFGASISEPNRGNRGKYARVSCFLSPPGYAAVLERRETLLENARAAGRIFWREAIEEKIEKTRGYYESDAAVFRLRCAGAAFCLGFAFSMLCLSACIKSIICARCGASGAATVISPPLLFSSSMA